MSNLISVGLGIIIPVNSNLDEEVVQPSQLRLIDVLISKVRKINEPHFISMSSTKVSQKCDLYWNTHAFHIHSLHEEDI
jgi:hypothetical protein